MRKIVIGLTVVLALTGLLAGFGGPLRLSVHQVKWLFIAHIWVGFFFIVLFPLYAWDHVSANRRWLKRPAAVTLTGSVQVLSALLLIVTGVLLYLYGVQTWQAVRDWHHWLTYPLAAAIAVHYLSPKRRGGPPPR